MLLEKVFFRVSGGRRVQYVARVVEDGCGHVIDAAMMSTALMWRKNQSRYGRQRHSGDEH